MTADVALANACVARVRTAFAAGSNLFHTAYTAQVNSEVDEIDPLTGNVTDTLATTPVAVVNGTGGTPNIAPPATAMLVRLRTGTFIAGRRVVGGAYLSPLAQGLFTSDGTPAPAQLAITAAFGAALVPGDGSAPHLVVWSRPYVMHAPSTRPSRVGSVALVTVTTVKDQFAVLRSRRG